MGHLRRKEKNDKKNKIKPQHAAMCRHSAERVNSHWICQVGCKRENTRKKKLRKTEGRGKKNKISDAKQRRKKRRRKRQICGHEGTEATRRWWRTWRVETPKLRRTKHTQPKKEQRAKKKKRKKRSITLEKRTRNARKEEKNLKFFFFLSLVKVFLFFSMSCKSLWRRRRWGMVGGKKGGMGRRVRRVK